MNITDLIEFFKDIKGVPRISMANLVTFPKYCSPLYLHQHHIQQGLDKVHKYLQSYKKVSDSYYSSDKLHVSGINNINSVTLNHSDEDDDKKTIQKRMMEWIDFCLIARQNNEDIYELAPYLKEYK